MRKDFGPKAAPPAIMKPSAIDLAVLLVLCPLAGVGAGLAFDSALLGLLVAAVGLIAVGAFGAAANVRKFVRPRRQTSRPLSVTDISTRRRGAPSRTESGPAPTPEPEAAPDVGDGVSKAADPDRIILFRMPSVR